MAGRAVEARARPILGEVCAQIADVQVRNRGTIGGNVCSSDPTNHLPPLLVALGATLTVTGADGEREVPAEERAYTDALTGGTAHTYHARPRSGSRPSTRTSL